MTITERLAAIRERVAQATPGPWTVEYMSADHRVDRIVAERYRGSCPPETGHGFDWDAENWDGDVADWRRVIVETECGVYPPRANDAEFIAAAREDVPWLLDQLEKARGALRNLRDCEICEEDYGKCNGCHAQIAYALSDEPSEVGR